MFTKTFESSFSLKAHPDRETDSDVVINEQVERINTHTIRNIHIHMYNAFCRPKSQL